MMNTVVNSIASLVRVESISVETDFGVFSPSGLPFNLTLGEQRTLNVTVLVPLTAIPGNHSVTATANWSLPGNYTWVPSTPLVVTGSITVENSPLFGQLAALLTTKRPEIGVAMGGYFGFATLLTLVVARREQFKRRSLILQNAKERGSQRR